MAVIASIVVGADGSTSLNGNSTAISTSIDRERFLARRRLFDAIIVGGNTARAEEYKKTPVPLVIISHSRPDLLDQNPKAHWWMMEATEALSQAQSEFGESVGIEGGAKMIQKLIDTGSITQLILSITPRIGGEKKIDPQSFLSAFENVEKEVIDDTIFYTCTIPITNQK